MDELSLEEELDLLHEYGKCLGARIVSPIFLEQQFILGEYKFIVFFRKIKDFGGYGDIYEIDKIIRFLKIFNFGE